VRVSEDLGVIQPDNTFFSHEIIHWDITYFFGPSPPGLLYFQELEAVLGNGDTPEYTYYDPRRGHL